MGTRPVRIRYRKLRPRIRYVADDDLLGVINRIDTGHSEFSAGTGRQHLADFHQSLVVRNVIDQLGLHVKRRFAGMRGRRSDLGHNRDKALIAKPSRWREEDKGHNHGANHVVLPDSSLIVPQNETPETGGHSPQCINRGKCVQRPMVASALPKFAGEEMTKVFPFRRRILSSMGSG
jgi:hypothetical protein